MKRHMTITLLALVPPSYIIVPNRVVVNKFFTIPSAIPFDTSISTLPSVKEMNVDNDTITRGRTTFPSKSISRSSSISSSTSSMAYHDWTEIENNILNDSQKDRDKYPHLSYADIQANGMSTGRKVDTSLIAGVTQPINEIQTSWIQSKMPINRHHLG